MFLKIVEKMKSKSPPDVNWKLQKQTSPPTFGWARLVSDIVLEKEIARRTENCSMFISNSKSYCDFREGKISLIVLSCKRLHTLKRLIESARTYFENIDAYPYIEKILVDNGSGEELIEDIRKMDFFDRIIAHSRNLGMVGALKHAYRQVDGEYVLLVEDDFVLDYDKPFIEKCLRIFREFPEIGIIRLKNQNNWWKPHRVIGPIRKTSTGVEFWTWLPSKDGKLNVWVAGSVMFRKVSYFTVGELPDVPHVRRKKKFNHAYIYEYVYGKKYNKHWLAAKIQNCYPFVQPNDNLQSPGWG